jgi:hypothetical protein
MEFRPMKPSLTTILAACCLCGCSTLTFEPNRAGPESECATTSANLPMYNECMADVDTFFENYEQHRRQAESADG